MNLTGSTPFRKDIFVDVVRSILCSFYDDDEIMVANFLLEGDIAYTDQQISESIGVPQRQVRATLEARLCKDFITEAEIPSAGQVGGQAGGVQGMGFGGGSAWYRISPDVLNVTWYRLTQTEKAIVDKLKSLQESESYICHRCGGREFDSLRAVSLFSQQDGLFHCDICEDILNVRENKAMREEIEKIQNIFHTNFEPLKARLESLRKMYIPRHIVLKKTIYEKMLEDAKKSGLLFGESGSSGHGERFMGFKRDFTQFANVLSNLTTTSGVQQPFTASAPSWIREAQGQGVNRETSIEASAVFSVATNSVKKDQESVVVLAKTESVVTTDVKTIIESSGHFGGTKKEEVTEKSNFDHPVSVGGQMYPISQVRNNDSLIERMTDDEYVRFDELIQRLGYK
jgi:transcription initiation factor IIE alpha subunit